MKLPEALKLVTDTLWRAQSKEHFSWSLEDLLTPAEIVEIADRIVILRMLRQGHSQRDIVQELGVSVTTVSRGSRVLRYKAKGVADYLEPSAEERNA